MSCKGIFLPQSLLFNSSQSNKYWRWLCWKICFAGLLKKLTPGHSHYEEQTQFSLKPKLMLFTSILRYFSYVKVHRYCDFLSVT